MKKIVGLFLAASMIFGTVPTFATTNAESMQSKETANVEETSQSKGPLKIEGMAKKAVKDLKDDVTKSKPGKNRTVEKTITIKYVLEEGGEPIGTEEISLPLDAVILKLSALNKVPDKYEIVRNTDIEILGTTTEVEIIVQKKAEETRDITVKYVLEEGGEPLETEKLSDISYDQKVIKISDLKKIPEGYEVIDESDRNIVATDNEIEIVVKKTVVPEEKFDITVNFVDEESGKIVDSFVHKDWKASDGYEIVLLDPDAFNSDLNKLGYKLKVMDKDAEYDIDKDTHIVEIPVVKIENENNPVNPDDKDNIESDNNHHGNEIDDNIASAKTPKTGDKSNVILYTGLLGVAILSLFAVKRKSSKHNA